MIHLRGYSTLLLFMKFITDNVKEQSKMHVVTNIK